MSVNSSGIVFIVSHQNLPVTPASEAVWLS
jgi:hypothetical protein